MTKHDFEPVAFEEPKNRRLRPLFVGRIADALDSVADVGSLVFSAALVFGGIGLLAYNLYSVVVTLASRGSWLFHCLAYSCGGRLVLAFLAH